jgi:hypothetical protein
MYIEAYKYKYKMFDFSTFLKSLNKNIFLAHRGIMMSGTVILLLGFGGVWQSLAYPESLFWVRAGCIFTLLFKAPNEQVL